MQNIRASEAESDTNSALVLCILGLSTQLTELQRRAVRTETRLVKLMEAMGCNAKVEDKCIDTSAGAAHFVSH